PLPRRGRQLPPLRSCALPLRGALPRSDTLLDIPPVLIVGAAPTGLAAAMSLARARVPVRVIDKLAAPAPDSRAIGIQARTLELLDRKSTRLNSTHVKNSYAVFGLKKDS